MNSHGFLKRLYHRYNRDFFDGMLPNADVRFDANVSRKDEGDTIITEFEDGTKHWLIRLDPSLRPHSCWYKIVLLHEMAHVKLYPERRHGKKHDDEMLRLATRGAFKGLW